MLHNLASEWREHPILMTLDSVAVPVSEVQFPTVTVCQDDTPPDNWAMVRKLARFYDYRCRGEEEEEGKKCEDGNQLIRY